MTPIEDSVWVNRSSIQPAMNGTRGDRYFTCAYRASKGGDGDWGASESRVADQAESRPLSSWYHHRRAACIETELECFRNASAHLDQGWVAGFNSLGEFLKELVAQR